MKDKALILLSGGQDTATCLAWSIKKWGLNNVEAISFDYGSRHCVELKYAKKLTKLIDIKHNIIKVSSLKQIKSSSLLNNKIDINKKCKYDKHLPSTFIPGRNLLFLTLAASYGWKKRIKNIVIGVSQIDYSGYYDARKNFIESCQKTINLALFGKQNQIKIYTPLIYKTKCETVLLMKKLKHLDWYEYTHTCYEGLRPACGVCLACKLRIKGFKEAKIIDPINYKNKIDWSGCEKC